MATSPLAATLAGLSGTGTANGTVAMPSNTGKQSSGGVQSSPGGGGTGGTRGQGSARVAAAVSPGEQQGRRLPGTPTNRQLQPRQPRFSNNNPMLGTAPPPAPHPGLAPPYPDARSGAVTMMPNGVPVMPPPTSFLQAGMIPRMPASMVHGAIPAPPAQIGAPPTMPPVAQTHMPMASQTMQMPHVPPGGAPMPHRPGQTPQAIRRPMFGAR